MFLIWGWGYYNQKKVDYERTKCTRCNSFGYKRCYTQTRYISMFWIPIIPIGRRRTLCECPDCGQSRTVSYWTLKSLRRQELKPRLREFSRNPDNVSNTEHLLEAILETESRDVLRRIGPEIERIFANDSEVLLALAMTLSSLCMDDDSDRVYLQATTVSERGVFGAAVFENMALHSSARTIPKPAKPSRFWQLLHVCIFPSIVIALLAYFAFTAALRPPQKVYIVSGSDRAYEVEVNGVAFEMDPHERLRIDAARFGENEMEIRRFKRPVENVKFEIMDTIWGRINGGKFVVINPDRGAPILWEMRRYGIGGDYERSIYVGDMYYFFDHIDHEFELFPNSIELSSGEDFESRRRVSVLQGSNSMSIVQSLLAMKDYDAVRKYVTARLEDGDEDPQLQSMGKRIRKKGR